MYPLQNQRTSKSVTHGFASELDIHSKKVLSHLLAFKLLAQRPFYYVTLPKLLQIANPFSVDNGDKM